MDTGSARHGSGTDTGTGMADAGRDQPGRRSRALSAGLRVTGAGLLIAVAAIHLDLYVTGYRSIPVIGALLLMQVIVAFLLGAAVLVTGSRLASAAGAVFALATLGGYLLSIWVGLFGFREVRTTAGITAGVMEVAAFAALTVIATRPRWSGLTSGRWFGGWPGGTGGSQVAAGRTCARLGAGPAGAVAAGALSAVALVLLGVAVAGAGGRPARPSATAALKTATINGVTVLVNGKGFTLYWFALDSPARSYCTGTCTRYWPPVTGRPVIQRPIAGSLGTITRPDGSVQATYDGHPLYTYVGDTAPGQASGNDLTLNGGLWHEVTVPG